MKYETNTFTVTWRSSASTQKQSHDVKQSSSLYAVSNAGWHTDESVLQAHFLPLIVKQREHMFIYAAAAAAAPTRGSQEEPCHRIRVHGAQGVQDRAQLAEPARTPPVDGPHVLVERALSLPLKRVDVLVTLQLRHLTKADTNRERDVGLFKQCLPPPPLMNTRH